MDKPTRHDWFGDIETIISQPLSFKAKLAIGEEAYKSLRIKNAVVQAWDVAGVATTAAVVAKSSVVASTFFAPSGFLAALGFGAAVTPVGWVIAAGVVSGGAWLGITRHLKKVSASKVTVVPNFINTPMDVLALGLFDLLAPLALKVATSGTACDEDRRRLIRDHFVREWGYNPRFVDEGLRYIESKLDDHSVDELARTIADFTRANPDCNFNLMAAEILGFLNQIATADGRILPREPNPVNEIAAVFKAANKRSLKRQFSNLWRSLGKATARLSRKRG